MLTIKAVEALKPGRIVWDQGRGSVAGFGVRCQLKRPSYILKYLINGRQRWYWTPDSARDEARRLLGEVVKGHDPASAKSALRTSPTVAKLIDQYLALARAGKVLSARGKVKKASTATV